MFSGEVINADTEQDAGQRADNAVPVKRKRIFIQIREQPASTELQFGYKDHKADSIPGVTSTLDNRTFPTIEVLLVIIFIVCLVANTSVCCESEKVSLTQRTVW